MLASRTHLADEREAIEKSALEAAAWGRAVGRARRGGGAAVEALFDIAAATGWLAELAPHGRVDGAFVTRCARLARRLARAAEVEAAALRLGESSAKRSRRGRPAYDNAGLSAAGIERLARRMKDYPGEPEEGTRPGEIGIPGTLAIVDARARVRERSVVPGTRIALGPALSGNTRRLRVAARRAGVATTAIERKLGSAMALLDTAWPEAGQEVRDRTRLILTLAEPGLVSYSHLHRIGVTYLNVRNKTILDLADDLLHETAHHRLHSIERAHPLVRAHDTEAIRYWSPWRRTPRPVRGILHAAYTFSFRAELLRRIAERVGTEKGVLAGIRLPKAKLAWVRREAAQEAEFLRSAVADLKDASRRKLLTKEGRRIVAEIARSAGANGSI